MINTYYKTSNNFFLRGSFSIIYSLHTDFQTNQMQGGIAIYIYIFFFAGTAPLLFTIMLSKFVSQFLSYLLSYLPSCLVNNFTFWTEKMKFKKLSSIIIFIIIVTFASKVFYLYMVCVHLIRMSSEIYYLFCSLKMENNLYVFKGSFIS